MNSFWTLLVPSFILSVTNVDLVTLGRTLIPFWTSEVDLLYIFCCSFLTCVHSLQFTWIVFFKAIEAEPENDVLAELLASLARCVELLGKDCLGAGGLEVGCVLSAEIVWFWDTWNLLLFTSLFFLRYVYSFNGLFWQKMFLLLTFDKVYL